MSTRRADLVVDLNDHLHASEAADQHAIEASSHRASLTWESISTSHLAAACWIRNDIDGLNAQVTA